MINLEKVKIFIEKMKEIKAALLVVAFFISLLVFPFIQEEKDIFIKQEVQDIALPQLSEDVFFKSTSLIKYSIENLTDNKLESVKIEINNNYNIYRITMDSNSKYIQDNILKYSKQTIKKDHVYFDGIGYLPPSTTINIYLWGDFPLNIFDLVYKNDLISISINEKQMDIDETIADNRDVGIFNIDSLKSGASVLIYLFFFSLLLLLSRKIK